MTISLPKRLLTVATTALAALGLSAAGGWAAQQPQLIKYTTGMKLSSLSQHHDSDLVQLKSGKKITVGTLRLLDREAVKVRAAVPDSKRSPLLKFKPQANNIKGKISNISDYNAALKNADHETWKLPSGRLVTTGQLKFIQPHADKLSMPAR